jgi:hypothetical protein
VFATAGALFLFASLFISCGKNRVAELLLAPSQAAEAASLLVNFLAIVSWFALLRAKKSILK